MKFAHTYYQLLHQEFPSEWIESAISYKRLKKCIKRIEAELASIGLDVEKLRVLLNTQPAQTTPVDKDDGEATAEVWKYTLDESEPEKPAAKAGPPKFVPKLLFAVDETTGEPLDVRLDPATKRQLHELAVAQSLTDIRLLEDEDDADPADFPGFRRTSTSSSSSSRSGSGTRHNSVASTLDSRSYRMVEVPMESDSEFFRTLQHQLTNIAALQKKEEVKLTTEITALGTVIERVARPSWRGRATHDLRRWRQIFQLYLDHRIFVSTSESDRGAHNHEQAQKRWAKFLDELQKQNLQKNFKVKESHKALERFLQVNHELLRSLRFQDLNGLAMTKILKKLSKRTALSPRPAPGAPLLPAAITSPILSHEFSRSIVYVLSNSLLSLIPQLDDHLCPICAGIAYLPIRLPCRHIFCIRCVILLQRRNERNCPLCRQGVVMQTSPENLDWEHAAFLRKWFRKEAMAKHRENERANAIDAGAPTYNEGCIVM